MTYRHQGLLYDDTGALYINDAYQGTVPKGTAIHRGWARDSDGTAHVVWADTTVPNTALSSPYGGKVTKTGAKYITSDPPPQAGDYLHDGVRYRSDGAMYVRLGVRTSGDSKASGKRVDDQGRMYVQNLSFALKFKDLGSGVVDTTGISSGSGTATFARATTAYTRLSNGLLASVASGSPRSYYTAPTVVNNLLQSNTFNTTWADQVGTVTETQDETGIDGTTSAWTVTDDSAAAIERAYQDVAIASDTASYTFSIYVKKTTSAASFPGLSLILLGGTQLTWEFLVNTDAGTMTARSGNSAGATTSVEDYSGSFWRVRISGANNGTNATARCSYIPAAATTDTATWSATATGSAVITCAQFEQASTPGTYVKTTTTIAGTGGTYLGYLAEGARTNLCIQSEQLNNTTSAWNAPVRATISANAITAPDGAVTADKLVLDATAANNHYVTQSVTYGASTAYALSVFAKAGEKTWAFLNIYDGSTNRNCYFDLTNGAVGTASNATGQIDDYGNGWYRCTINVTTGAGAGAGTFGLFIAEADNDNTIDGDSASGLYYWGAQLEAASFPSSYIPTTTASVTRNADVLTYTPGGNVDATVGSALAQITSNWNASGLTGTAACVYFGSAANNGALYSPNTGPTNIRCADGTNAASQTVTSYYLNPTKVGSSWAGSQLLVTGGGLASANATFDGDMGIAAIGVGCASNGTANWHGTISEVRIYNYAMTDVQLQAITS